MRGNILQIGVDIERISRFTDKTPDINEGFLKRVYTEKELEYCLAKKFPAKHLAARFCAKEAVIKAMSNVYPKTLSLNEIEVLKNENGSPYIKLHNCEKNFDISVSLSHDREKAIAFVVLNDEAEND